MILQGSRKMWLSKNQNRLCTIHPKCFTAKTFGQGICVQCFFPSIVLFPELITSTQYISWCGNLKDVPRCAFVEFKRSSVCFYPHCLTQVNISAQLSVIVKWSKESEIKNNHRETLCKYVYLHCDSNGPGELAKIGHFVSSHPAQVRRE